MLFNKPADVSIDNFAMGPRELAPGSEASLLDQFNSARRAGTTGGGLFSGTFNLGEAYDDEIRNVKELVGVELKNPEYLPVDSIWGLEGRQRQSDDFFQYQRDGGTSGMTDFNRQWSEREFRKQLKEVKAKHPEFADKIDDETSFFERGIKKNIDARNEDQDVWARSQQGFTDHAAWLAGTISAGLTDPLNLATLPFSAPARVGWKAVSYAATRAALLNAGTEAVAQPVIREYNRSAGLDYTWGDSAKSIAAAAAFGFVMDAGGRAISRGAQRGLRGFEPVVQDGVVVAWKKPSDIPKVTAPDAPLAAAPEIDPELMKRLEAGDIEASKEILAQIDRTSKATGDVIIPDAVAKRIADGDEALTREVAERVAQQDPVFRQELSAIDADANVIIPPDASILPAEHARVTSQAIKHVIDPDSEPMPVRVMADPQSPAVIPKLEKEIASLKAKLDEAKPDPEMTARIAELEAQVRRLDMVGRDPVADALLIRENPAFLTQDIDPSLPGVKTAIANAKLSDEAFAMVQSGQAPAELGEMVSDFVADPLMHSRVLSDLMAMKPANEIEARSRISELLRSPEYNRTPEADVGPVATASKSPRLIDDPYGAEAKAQTQFLEQKFKEELSAEGMAPSLADEVLTPEGQAASVARASEIDSVIAEFTGIAPSNVAIRGFDAISDLPPTLRAKVRQANAVRFGEQLNRFMGSKSEAERLAARAELDAASRGEGIEGIADGDTIWIASFAQNPRAKIAHEVVHSLRRTKQLRPEEEAILAAAAREAGVFSKDREGLYRDAYADRSNVDSVIEEEAAAHYIEAFVRGDIPASVPINKPAMSIVERLLEFADRIREALGLKGYRAPSSDTPVDPARDVVAAILNGEVAKREMASAQESAMMFSMRNDTDSLGYYSGALRAANNLRQEKGTPEQILAMLKKEGAKDAEIEATGLGKFIASRDSGNSGSDVTVTETPSSGDRTSGKADSAGRLNNQITKSEIIEFLEKNKVGLNEASYRAERTNEQLDAVQDRLVAQMEREFPDIPLRSLQTTADGFRWQGVERDDGASSVRASIREMASPQLRALIDELTGGQAKAQWSSYSLDPSNPTYRETVLHLPSTLQKKGLANSGAEVARLEAQIAELEAAGRWDEAEELGVQMERLEGLRDAAGGTAETNISISDFQSGHFSESNIIGHMMTSMTSHKGKSVYTIDQIQSDWGQKLRDGGVRDEAKIEELKRRGNSIAAELNAIESVAREEAKAIDQSAVAKSLRTDWENDPAGDVAEAIADYFNANDGAGVGIQALRFASLWRDLRLVDAEKATAQAATPGNPLVNTTDQWTNTTLRRAIRQAAEADAEYIAIPSGDTVLSYNPGDRDGMHGFYGRVISDAERASKKAKIEQLRKNGDGPIADDLERDLASTIEGIVPKNLRKLLTKIDRDTPAPERIETLDSPSGKTGLGKGFTLFKLTDKVKQSVMTEGQPLFGMRQTHDVAHTATKDKGAGEYLSAKIGHHGYGYTASGEAMLVATDPARMMDWKGREQTPEVTRALDAVGFESGLSLSGKSGQAAYRALSEKIGSDDLASAALLNAGIQGHKETARGFENIVVYDPSLVQRDPMTAGAATPEGEPDITDQIAAIGQRLQPILDEYGIDASQVLPIAQKALAGEDITDDLMPLFAMRQAYHSTSAKFDKFDESFTDEVGFHFGTKLQARDRAYIKANGNPLRYLRSRIIPVVLDINNPAIISQDVGYDGVRLAEQLVRDRIAPPSLIRDIQGAEPKQQTKYVRDWLVANGYDAVQYINEIEGPGAPSYMALGTGNVRHAETGETLFAMRDDASDDVTNLVGDKLRTHELPGYGSPEFDAARKFNVDGAEATGYEAGISLLADKARAMAGPDGLEQGRKVTLLIGPPGAGKSTVGKAIAQQTSSAFLSADDAKAALPEYEGGANAQGVHVESTRLADMVMQSLARSGDNFILETLGRNYASMSKVAETLKSVGYDVRVVAVTAPRDALVSRIRSRAEQTGRNIDLSIMDETLSKLPDVIDKSTAATHLFSGVTTIDNGGDLPYILSGKEKLDAGYEADLQSRVRDLGMVRGSGGADVREYGGALERIGDAIRQALDDQRIAGQDGSQVAPKGEGEGPLFAMRSDNGRIKRGAERRAKVLGADIQQIEGDLKAAAIDQREALQRKRATFLNAQAEESGLDDIVKYRSPRGQEDLAIAFLRMHESFGVHSAPYADVAGLRQEIARQAVGKMSEVMWELRKGALLGDLKRVKNARVRTRMENMIREAAGEKTGDAVAARMAKAWLDTAEWLRQSFNAAGGDIQKLDGWFAPQYHDAELMLKAGRKSWVDRMMQDGVLDRARMVKRDGTQMTDGELREMLSDIWSTITTDGANKRDVTDSFGKGALYKRHAEHRVLHFKDADAFLNYAKEFGRSDPYSMMLGHIQMMARDIAALRRFGANPELVRQRLKDHITLDAKASRSARSVFDDLSDMMSDLTSKLNAIQTPAEKAMAKMADIHTKLDKMIGKPRMKAEREVLRGELFKVHEELQQAMAMKAETPEQKALTTQISALLDEMDQISETQPVMDKNPEQRARRILLRADEMWKIFNGSTNVPTDGNLAGGMSAFRNWTSASVLAGASISAITDQATGLAARAFVGMPVTKQLGSFLKGFTAEDRKFALRAQVGLDQTMNAFAVSTRFMGFANTAHLTGYLTDRTHAFSGLAAMTQASKIGFASDFMSWMAELSKKSYGGLPSWTKDMMNRHGFTEQDFVALKTVTPEMHRGVPVLTRPAIERDAGAEVAERYMRMLLREQSMAVLEPTLQGRTAWISETKPGSIIGEMARSVAMLKSFPTTYTMLILGRFQNAYLQGKLLDNNTVATAASIFVVGTMLGALAMQMKSLNKGEDPQPMDSAAFWQRAFMQSGGVGIFGDFIANSTNRNGGGLAQTIQGPLTGTAGTVLDATVGNVFQYAKDEPTNFGRESVNLARRMTPGAFVPFYARAAYERMLLDQLQEMVDPEAHKVWRRRRQNLKKRSGNDFYWPPGQSLPSRGPDLGSVVSE